MSNASVTQLLAANKTILNDGPRSTFDFERQPGLVFVIVASSCASLWLFYITFYHSRVLGLIFTKILSKFFVKDGYIHVGSFSISLLSGKFMFRDIKYITKDYSLRIVDGYGIFKWWLGYNPDQAKFASLQQDVKMLDNRVILQINGFELHFYNRSSVYDKIKESLKVERYGDAGKSAASLNVSPTNEAERKEEISFADKYNLRDLIPSVGFHIHTGKVAFGNKGLETTLWMHFNHATATYSTPAASCPLDDYCHMLNCRFEDFRILLSPSPGHPGMKVKPPRFMGEGFVLLQSGEVKARYYQDQPGLVPEVSPEFPHSDPTWGLDIAFTKNTTMTYGPWADKQRDHLQRFFFPPNFQEQPITKALDPGQRRFHSGFDFKIDFQAQFTIDLLFTKNEETSAIHIFASPSSSLNFYMPWTVNEYGYMSNIFVQLQHVEMSSSLEYRNILLCDSLDIAINMTIPRTWNHFQHWTCEVTLRKTTIFFIYRLKEFFHDLINDWSVTEPYDVAHFVPYEWTFTLLFHDFELICMANQYNWIDCTNEQENSQVAFCGESLEVTFSLPFTRFLPSVEEVKVFFQAETVVARSILPVSNTLRRSTSALARCSNQAKSYPSMYRLSSATSERIIDGNDVQDEVDNGISDGVSGGWCRKTKQSDGWIDIWTVPFLGINISYRYHPIPVADTHTQKIHQRLGLDYSKVKPTSLEPDLITVELEAGPSAVKLYGSFLRQFMLGLKDNYFGVSQVPTEFNATKQTASSSPAAAESHHAKIEKDPRHYRPFEANITVVLLDMKGELSKHCGKGQDISPVLHVNRLTFEMHKTFAETRMQLILSPATVVVKDTLKRHHEQQHLNHGYLSLSGLQFRGHAMFSDHGLQPDQDTLEYAWLTEIQCGDVSGRLTLVQLQSLLCWLEVFALHVVDEENVLTPQSSVVKCQHGVKQDTCKVTAMEKGCDEAHPSTVTCLTEADLKYRMTRLSVESVRVFLVESECACSIMVAPVRVSFCTSHAVNIIEGASLFINDVAVRQYIQMTEDAVDTTTTTTPATDTPQQTSNSVHLNEWVEVASALFGPITADVASISMDENHKKQQKVFLASHDKFTKRLWFLWNPDMLSSRLATDRARGKICGCVGGCAFFGVNVNGVRFFSAEVLDAGEAKFSRYGSESLWGGTHEKQTRLKDRFRKQSLQLSSPSYGSGLYPVVNGRPAGAHQRSASYGGGSLPGSTAAVGPRKSVGGKVHDSTRSFDINSTDQTPPASLFKRKRSATRSRDASSSASRGKLSRTESEMTFYSCESDLSTDEEEGHMEEVDAVPTRETVSNMSLRSGSTGSFVSAVASANGSMSFDTIDGASTFAPLVDPQLLDHYAEHMHKNVCVNWRQSVPDEMKRKFSIIKNLKSVSGPAHATCSLALPSFQPVRGGKLPFVIVNKPTVEDDSSGDADEHVFVASRSSVSISSKNQTGCVHVSVKIHRQMNIVVTPLLPKAIERYATCLAKQRNHQHPAYVLDSLHFSCISSSKQEYVKFQALSELQRWNGNSKLVEKHFPCSATCVSAKIPQVNLVMFQLSDDFARSSSEHGSRTSESSSRHSIDRAESTGTKVVLGMRLVDSTFQLLSDGTNQPLFNAKLSFLQRSLSHHENTSDPWNCQQRNIGTYGLMLDSQALEFQVQHLLSPSMPNEGHTLIPHSKSAVEFSVMQGEDIDMDDVFLVEPRSSDPIGLIVLEGCMSKISATNMAKDSIEKLSISKKSMDSVATLNIDPNVKGSSHEYRNPLFFKQMSIIDKDTRESNFGCSSQDDSRALLLDNDTNCGGGGVDAATGQQGVPQAAAAAAARKPPLDDIGKTNSVATSDTAKTNNKCQRIEILSSSESKLTLQDIWINIATPTRLRPKQEHIECNVNIVTTLAPSIACWISAMVDVSQALLATYHDYRNWRSTVLACCMSQALPEPGRLLKKHNITSKATPESCFLQEEYSGQLIYVLRRHVTGSRLAKLTASLQEKSIPSADTIAQGIDALARQWKCVIIGAETKETLFDSRWMMANKKHVVGRGILTQRDLALLMQDPTVESKDTMEVTDTTNHRPAAEAFEIDLNSDALRTEFSSPALVNGSSTSEVSESESDNLLQRKASRASVVNSAAGKDSLYHLMSRSVSPARVTPDEHQSPTGGRHVRGELNHAHRNGPNEMADLLRSSLPMVSVPTSGMQLAEASSVFAAIFNAVHMSKCRNSKTPWSVSSSVGCVLNSVSLYLIDSCEDTGHRPTRGGISAIVKLPPAFFLESFNASSISKESSQSSGGDTRTKLISTDVGTLQSRKKTDVIISVRCITQKFNIASIRLLTQMVETTDTIMKEKKFVHQLKEFEQLRMNTKHGSYADQIDGRDDDVMALDAQRSWKTMFNVLNLYKTLPSFGKNHIEVKRPSKQRGKSRSERPDVRITIVDSEDGPSASSPDRSVVDAGVPVASDDDVETMRDHVLVVVKKVVLHGSVGGLSLEGELKNLMSSVENSISPESSEREKSSGASKSFSVSTHLDGCNVMLRETNRSSKHAIVRCKMSRSHMFYSWKCLHGNPISHSMTTQIGPIVVNIPQHPGVMRSVTSRFSKQLHPHFVELDAYRQSKRLRPPESSHQSATVDAPVVPSELQSAASMPLSFRVYSHGVKLSAALLPSLQAEYKIKELTSWGRYDKRKSSFFIDLATHGLHFEAKNYSLRIPMAPSTAVNLPSISVEGNCRTLASSTQCIDDAASGVTDNVTSMAIVVNVGELEQTVTTDLMNNMIYLQKGFVKEVNEVIEKAEKEEVPFWMDNKNNVPPPVAPPSTRMLFSVHVNLKGIRITATTPSSTALRLETGRVGLELTNENPRKSQQETYFIQQNGMRLFGKAEIDLMVSLGQFVKMRTLEGDQEFEHLAYFKSKILLSNTVEDRLVLQQSEGKETVIITLSQPRIFVLPPAVDKGVLVYLHYKNDYEYWNEQLLLLADQVQSATQHIKERLPQRPPSPQTFNVLFMQLNVDNLAICIPLFDDKAQASCQGSMNGSPDGPCDGEPCSALILTVAESSITCCSSGSFVSRGLFRDFCVRFTSAFDYNAVEWQLNFPDIMNTLSVFEGTYELCSRTTAKPTQEDGSDPDCWVMSIVWRMCGFDAHVDASIGKRLSALGLALTSFARDVDVADLASVADDYCSDSGDEVDGHEADYLRSPDVSLHLNDTVTSQPEKLSLERHLWEQTRKVNELRRSDAPASVISREVYILKDIESALSNQFFRGVRRRFRRQSRRPASGLADVSIEVPPRSADRGTINRRHSSSDSYTGCVDANVMRRQRYSTSAKDPRLLSGSDPITLEVRPPISEDEVDGNSDDLSQTFSDPVIFPGAGGDSVFRSTVPVVTVPDDDPICDSTTPRVTFSQSTADVRDSSEPTAASPKATSQTTSVSTSLDFELDLVVGIESGRCVFHAEHDPTRQQQAESATPLFRPLSDHRGRKVSDQTDNLHSKERSRYSDSGVMGAPTQGNAASHSAPHRSMSYQLPTRRLKSSASLPNTNAGIVEDMILLVPAIDLRSHYRSKTCQEQHRHRQHSDSSAGNGSSFGFSSSDTLDSNVTMTDSASALLRSAGSKSAGLHVWISVQQLPREMILRPSLLDFIEKALQPIVVPAPTSNDTENSDTMSTDESETDLKGNSPSVVSSSATEYSSFPVDIVVFIRVQPSDIRLSCLPISKVECLLRIPSLDVVISSRPVAKGSSRSQPAYSPKRQKSSVTSLPGNRSARLSQPQSPLDGANTSGLHGGLTFTVCLSRFSFCVFHPYGKQYGSTSDARSFVESGLYPGKRKSRMPPQPISGRKDSLSLNVEFVKFNLVRRRMKVPNVSGKLRRTFSVDDSKTTVKVSAICDIGSASFNYDMRRLNEILDVPKAWYRSQLYRRMFLGKEGSYATKTMSTPQNQEEAFVVPSGSDPLLFSESYPGPFTSRASKESSPLLTTPTRSHPTHRRAVSGSILGNIMTPPFLSRSATVGSRADVPSRVSPSNQQQDLKKEKAAMKRDWIDQESQPQSSSSQTSQSGPIGGWETNVIIALNLARMDVAANMGNVMGQAIWSTSDLRGQSRFLVNNNGTKTMASMISVGQGSFDAHGGIVGGFIEVQDIFAQGNFEENLDCLPSHKMNVDMRSGEARIDYMGSCIFMASMSAFRTNLKDEWQLANLNQSRQTHYRENQTDSSTSQPRSSDLPSIEIDGEIGWNELQIVMSRSTTPDLYKMVAKLEEFFAQQHRSGVRALSSFHSTPGVPLDHTALGHGSYRLDAESQRSSDSASSKLDGLKYQHWVEILNALPSLTLNNIVPGFGERGAILGGRLTLKADFLSLACFHGSNFRAQHWALFTLREPLAKFHSTLNVVERSCQVKRAAADQELTFHLGHTEGSEKRARSPSQLYDFMATVRKVSRGRRNPPSLGAPVHEWLNFVNSTTDEEEPAATHGSKKTDTTNKPNDKYSVGKQTIARKVSFAPKFRYENESEIIFALPQLSLRMFSKHDQPMTSRVCAELLTPGALLDDGWLSTVPSPHMVECFFDSVFKDSLDVTMDVGLLFFLHELIQAYLKEKETYLAASHSRSFRASSQALEPREDDISPSATSAETKNAKKTTTAEKYRHFKCERWKVEPKIRLLSWAGKRMDPVSIDWVLEKLGFMNAALTIPKWLQRGAMDPMDIALSAVVQKLLASMMMVEQDGTIDEAK